MAGATFRVVQGRAQVRAEGGDWQALPLGLDNMALQSRAAQLLQGGPLMVEDLDESHRWAVGLGLAAGVALASQPPPKSSLDEVTKGKLFQFERTVGWQGPNHPTTKALLQQLMALLPAEEHGRIREARTRGEAWHEATGRLDQALMARRPLPELEALLEATVAASPAGIQQALKKHMQQRLQRHRLVLARMAHGHLPPALKPSAVDHRLEALPPSPLHWVLLDETGSFPAAAGDRLPKGEGQAGVVALVIPEACAQALPTPPPGWHAVERSSDQEWDRWLQVVLDHPIGVVGVSVDDLAQAQVDAWMAAVMQVLRQVLWRTPIQGPTTFRVLVERQGTHAAGTSWEAAAAALLAEANHLWPDRWREVRLELEVTSKDGHPLMPYADAVAYTWGARDKARLRLSGLERHCLGAPAPAGSEALMKGGVALGGHPWPWAWAQALGDPFAAREGGLVWAALAQAKARAAQDSSYPLACAEAVRRHLDSKAVDLPLLGKQVAALKALGSPSLGAVGELAIALAGLELENHQGLTAQDQAFAIHKLAKQVLNEAPSLACQADLALAVRHLNRLDVGAAEGVLATWAQESPRVPGLQHWARVQSSLAQCAAFRGQWGLARALAEKAMQAFYQLSDEALAEQECQQTRSYWAMATFDDPLVPPQAKAEALVDTVGPLHEALPCLTGEAMAAHKYQHHLLVRYLAEHGSRQEVAGYLDAMRPEALATGHPWPAIAMHQSRLLRRVGRHDEAQEALALARELAQQEPGALMQCLALAYHRLGQAWGWWGEPDWATWKLSPELPALAWAPKLLWRPWKGEEELFEALPFYLR